MTEIMIFLKNTDQFSLNVMTNRQNATLSLSRPAELIQTVSINYGSSPNFLPQLNYELDSELSPRDKDVMTTTKISLWSFMTWKNIMLRALAFLFFLSS